MGAEIRQDLAPVVRGMVDDVKKDVLKAVRKKSPFRIFVFHPAFPELGIGDNLEGIPLVVVMDLLPCTYFMCLPDLKFPGPFQDPGIPYMMGIQDMVEKQKASPGNGFQPGTKGDQLFVRMIVIVKYLVEKCFHSDPGG
jgi:hypothetical protein